MLCRQCQSDNPDASRFCDSCGTSLAVTCGGCGASARPGARFCGDCGEKLGAAPAPAKPDPARRTKGQTLRPIDEGERKQVTVLFADIRGSTRLIETLDPEVAMGVLDPAVRAMSAAVDRFGGTVNRVQGDGIMALFGAPLATEDHAIRACLAAQAVIAAVAASHGGLAVRVGLHSGEVVIRAVGLDPNDYDAVGVTVHLAHRLEQLAAPGTVRLSARTALLAHGAIDIEALGAEAVAGLAEPVESFRLVQAHERPAWEVRAAAGGMTRFVGREEEMRLLESTLRRVALSRGQVLTLTADAGLGKSRLVHEFLKRLPAGACTVVRAAAMPHGRGTPYRLAADILRALLGAGNRDGRAEVARRLAQSLTLLGLSDPAEQAPLESLLDLPVTDPGWAELSPDGRLERMLPALRPLLLRQSAVRPLLLLLEDLHWADPQSEALLEALVDGLGASQLMLLVTTRPGREPAWSGRRSRSYCAGLHLGPLEPAAAERLLSELLGDSPELSELRARIVAQSDGTPLFIEELSRALIEQGVIVAAPPSHRLTRKVVEIQIPASVQAVLAARIDQLPADRRRVLQVAAVIGRDVPHDILAALVIESMAGLQASGLSHASLGDLLGELQAAEFLYEIDLPGGREYTFKHALTQAVAYEGMLRSQRRDLHARALDALSGRAGDRADELCEVLADHALRGQVWGRASVLQAQAGRRAVTRSAWREAILFFENALEAVGHLPETRETMALGIDIRLGLRQSLGPILEMDRVIQVLDEAGALARRLDDPARMAQIDVSRCLFETILGRLDGAIATGTRGLQEAGRLEDPGQLLNATYALAQANWFAGNFGDAARLLEAQIHLVRGPMRLRSTGTTGTVSVLYLVCLAKTRAMCGNFAEAHRLSTEAHAIADETGKAYDLTYARLSEGFTHLLEGRLEEAALPLGAALEHCRAGSILLLVPSVARYLGRVYAQLGRVTEAHALMDEALATCHAQNMVALTVWCGLASGHSHLAGGTHDDAETRLGTSLELARRHAYRPAEAHALHLLGRSYLARAQGAAGLAALDEAEVLARALGMVPEMQAIAATRGEASKQSFFKKKDQKTFY